MAVGGLGMLSTSNYAARRFGVRAAMPGFIARRLCPDLVIVPPDMAAYAAEAERIRDVFRAYDPNYLPMSLDEAYLDLTDYLRRHPEQSAASAVAEMRARIAAATQLTASAGIAPNTFLAKVCSDLNKPNGQYELPATAPAVQEFVDRLSIRKRECSVLFRCLCLEN
jgi:DNA polymerase kappa